MKHPTKPQTSVSVLPCTYYDKETSRDILNGAKGQDIANKSIFFYTYYGNYPIEHKHDYWEFILVLSGNYTHLLNGRNFQLNKNHACLIRPDIDRHSLKNGPQGSKHFTIRIRKSYMEQICNGIEEDFYQSLLKRPVILFSLSSAKLM